MKKLKQFWKNLFSRGQNKKETEVDFNTIFETKQKHPLWRVCPACLLIINKKIKEDLQKIINKDGFISDIQEYINEL